MTDYRKQRIKVLVSLALFVSILGCASEKKKDTVAREKQVFVEEIPAMTVVTVNRIGSYSEIAKVITETIELLERKGISTTGIPFAFYYNSPEMVPPESCEWAVCIPVPAGTSGETQAGMNVRVLEPMEVALAFHTGGWDNVSATYQQVMEWIANNDWEIAGPAVEFFLSPAEDGPDSIRTKVGFVITIVENNEDYEEEEEIEDGESTGDEG